MGEISFWLDVYDDIFSDFDPRSYHKRRLSEDFLDEIKAAFKYHKNHTEGLVLLLPRERRKEEIEEGIINQVKTQLQLRLDNAARKEKKMLRRGLALLVSGVLIMYIDSLITVKGYNGQLMVMLRIVMEPGSWFMMWTGLDALFYDYREARMETAFYKKIIALKMRFENI